MFWTRSTDWYGNHRRSTTNWCSNTYVHIGNITKACRSRTAMTEDAYEWARDKAEAEYFAHVESITHETTPDTHDYPLRGIVSSNELDPTEVPF